MRKKIKMANICRSLQKKTKNYPVLKSPTYIGFIGVKKNGLKISHLGTFKLQIECNAIRNTVYRKKFYLMVSFMEKYISDSL
jgi:hypothetical protein